MSGTTYRLPKSVVEDTQAFRHEVERFKAGDLSPVAFRAIRVPMGIYEQRENGTYMVRVRGAGGVFLSHQVKVIAELSERFGNGIVHVTTRQDLQLHRVLIEDTPAVLERLLEVGLSPRGGGGNTIRNVTACPMAGVCAEEVFDVTPYALVLTEYLLSNRANFNLPRKFKTSFSGCAKDCSLCSVADLGFFAHEKDGIRGFSVYAGGGMGAWSSLAVLIEEFIPDGDIFEVAEAVKRLFDKYGDRADKHKARLRFVLARVGEEEFRRLYREELEQVRREELALPEIRFQEERPLTGSEPEDEPDPAYQAWRKKNVSPEKQPGLYILRIPVPLGNIEAGDLRKVADLAVRYGDGTLRTTQDQDLQLRGVPGSELHRLYTTLKGINNTYSAALPIRCVACAGASTCRLGLCLSRELATVLESDLQGIDPGFDTVIRISGCPNACGQHPLAPIGLAGNAQRVDGKLVPFYVVYAGGRLSEGNSVMSQPIIKVPAKAIPALMREFWNQAAANRHDVETLNELIDRWGIDYLRRLEQKYGRVPSYEEAPDFYRDFGQDVDFSLAGRGPGECGAGVMDVIALDINAAKTALDQGEPHEAILAAARALLITRGLEPKKDREVFAAFTEHLINPGWVARRAQVVLDAALDVKLEDRDTLDDLWDDIRSLVKRVEELFRSLDSNLNFRVERVEEPQVEPSCDDAMTPYELDLRGVACPMNFVRAKIHLEQLEVGGVLDILLDDGEPARNVPASFVDQGQEVLLVESEGDHFRIKVRRLV